MTLETCLNECLAHPEFVTEYDRIRGTNIALKRHGLINEIDKATGKWESDIRDFFDFCRDYVYLPLLYQAIEASHD